MAKKIMTSKKAEINSSFILNLKNQSLSQADKKVAQVLFDETSSCSEVDITYSHLKAQTGKSHSTIIRALKKLADFFIVKIIRTRLNARGFSECYVIKVKRAANFFKAINQLTK